MMMTRQLENQIMGSQAAAAIFVSLII